MQSAPPLLAPPLRSTLDPRTPEFAENRAAMLEKLAEIDRLLDQAEAGGGPAHHARLAKRGKLPVRERIALALDPDSPFLEISPLAALQLVVHDRRRRGGRDRRDRGHRVRDLRQRPDRARRRAHALREQEVDARARDRARQRHPVRLASSSRPAPTCA